MANEKCPFCKRKSSGYVGKSILAHCQTGKETIYECERCHKKWKEEAHTTYKIIEVKQ